MPFSRKDILRDTRTTRFQSSANDGERLVRFLNVFLRKNKADSDDVHEECSKHGDRSREGFASLRAFFSHTTLVGGKGFLHNCLLPDGGTRRAESLNTWVVTYPSAGDRRSDLTEASRPVTGQPFCHDVSTRGLRDCDGAKEGRKGHIERSELQYHSILLENAFHRVRPTVRWFSKRSIPKFRGSNEHSSRPSSRRVEVSVPFSVCDAPSNGSKRMRMSDTERAPAHLKRGPELVRHEVVEQRVDGRRQVVQDARHVGEHLVDVDDRLVRMVFVNGFPVDGHQSLRLERCPAHEERNHYDY